MVAYILSTAYVPLIVHQAEYQISVCFQKKKHQPTSLNCCNSLFMKNAIPMCIRITFVFSACP